MTKNTPEEKDMKTPLEIPFKVSGEQPRIEDYFKTSMHAEHQKFNIGTKSRQLTLGEDIESLEREPGEYLLWPGLD